MNTKKTLEKYIGCDALKSIAPRIQEVVKIRNELFNEYGFDLLDSGDAISNILSYEIISQYDPEFEPNFHRNGRDAKDGSEMKSNRVEPVSEFTKTGKLSKANKFTATWTLHAVSDYSWRWIWIARDKKTLEILRIYDISEVDSVNIIVNHLEEQRQRFLKKYNSKDTDVTKVKNDRIGISEKFIRDNISFTIKKIGNCEVMKG
jgi:hypothetical protein